MKTLKKVPLELIYTKYIPQDLEFGKLYYSQEYEVCNHLCICGCGMKAPIPIMEGEWSLQDNNGKVTVHPSLRHRNGCKSHYVILNGIASLLDG